MTRMKTNMDTDSSGSLGLVAATSQLGRRLGFQQWDGEGLRCDPGLKFGYTRNVLVGSGGVLFAADRMRKDGTISKCFVRFPCYSSVMINLPRMNGCFYEVLPPGRPCRLYIDIDMKWSGTAEEQVKLMEVVGGVVNGVELVCGGLIDSTPLVLSACTSIKGSIHIVWHGVVFGSVYDMGQWVREVLLKVVGAEAAAVIDTGVYGQWQCWRIPLCAKLGKSNWLVPIGGVNDGSNDFRFQLLELGLVGNVTVNDVNIGFISHTSDRSGCGTGSGGGTAKYVYGLICPNVGRAHLNNRSVVVEEFSDGKRYLCLDPQCHNVRFAVRNCDLPPGAVETWS